MPSTHKLGKPAGLFKPVPASTFDRVPRLERNLDSSRNPPGRQPSGNLVDPVSLASCALCSASFVVWSGIPWASLTLTALLFALGLPWVLYLLGRGCLVRLRFATFPAHPFPLAFLVGSAVGSFLLFGLDLIALLSFRANCLVVAVVAIGLAVSSRDKRKPTTGGQNLATLFVVALSLAAATLWTQDMRPAVVAHGAKLIYRPWHDCFYHAQVIGLLQADDSLLKLGSPDFSGMPLPFYHYAFYLIPASWSAWTGIPALDTACSFLVPFGILLVGLAAFSLGCAWWGLRGGLAAVVGVLLVPDPSTHGLQVNWLSAHWVGVVSPGLLYGTAMMAFAVLLVIRGVAENRKTLSAVGLGVGLISVLMKAHVFVVAFPLLLAWPLLFGVQWKGIHRAGLGIGLLLLGCVGILAADRLGIGPNILPLGQVSEISTYWRVVYCDTRSELFGRWLSGIGAGKTLLEQPGSYLLLALGGCFGAWIIAYPACLLLAWRRGKLASVDALPALALMFFLVCAFVIANNQRGHVDELRHRPFVWAWFVLVVWVSGKLTQLFNFRADQPERLPGLLLIGLAVVLLIHPLKDGRQLQAGRARPKMDAFHDLAIPRDFVACCAFVRMHGTREDVVQALPTDHVSFVGGLTERRSFVARRASFWREVFPQSPAGHLAETREQQLVQLKQAQTTDVLRGCIQQTGIRWLILEPGENLAWPDELSHRCAFQAGSYRVYNLNALLQLESDATPGSDEVIPAGPMLVAQRSR